MVEVGKAAPGFALKNQHDEEVTLESLKGNWVVLYFYPKDNTPGCTTEACDFTERKSEFEGLDAVVVGVSPDSTKSHRGFIDKQDLDLILLSDPDHEALEPYGAWKLKKKLRPRVHGCAALHVPDRSAGQDRPLLAQRAGQGPCR